MSTTLERCVGEPLPASQVSQAQRAGEQIEQLLAGLGEGELVDLRSPERTESLTVPAAALRLFRALLEELSKGNAVQVLPIDAELTTQQAAELLNVSRPFVVKLVDEGVLPARKVGTHRRIRVEDVLDYRRRDDERRRSVLDELAEEAEELGLR